jgi:uncharacterized membrane protein HdeD (DUF308 family)
MSSETPIVSSTAAATPDHHSVPLQSAWWVFQVLGIILIVLGMVSLGSAFFVSLVTVIMFGFLILIAGIVQVVSSFWSGKWSGFLLHLLVGILYLVTGYITMHAPLAAVAGLTLVIAAMLLAAGAFRIAGAMVVRFPGWPWVLMNGIIGLLLGIMIFRQWPSSSQWVIGVFVGVELIFNGWAWIMLSLGVKNIPKLTI